LKKRLIIRQEYGQLGNILFRLSNTLAFAFEHRYRVEDYTLAFCNYHDGSSNIRFFENFHPFHFFEYPKPKLRFLNRIKWRLRRRSKTNIHMVENFETSFDLTSLSSYSQIELKGFHFCSNELALKYREKIVKILTFRKKYTDPIQAQLQKFRNTHKVLLGVHIRQNDFKDFYGGQFYHSSETYRKHILNFVGFFKDPSDVGIVICTDNLSMLESFLDFKPLTPRGNIAQDIYALSQCDYILSAKATTMSNWSAYYNNKPIYRINQDQLPKSIQEFKKISFLDSCKLF
jgi:hypothetical protein